MTDSSRILVVAATSRELATPAGWRAVKCGVGPVEAAAATAAAIERFRPSAILHVGIAGARRARHLPIGSLVIGSESVYCDLDPASDWAPRTVVASPYLLAALALVLPKAPQLTIGTSARVGGSSECHVEAMEGFAVLRAAQVANIPAVEVRAISNEVEEVDRAKWDFAFALAAITTATPSMVHAMQLVLDRMERAYA